MSLGPANVTLDAKGRFAVPARYRQSLIQDTGGKVYCVLHTDLCVQIYQPDVWARIGEQLEESNAIDAARFGRDVRRIFLGSLTPVAIDSAGRLRVPQELREFCDLERHAILLALGRNFELWDSARWRQRVLDVSAQSEALDEALRSMQL